MTDLQQYWDNTQKPWGKLFYQLIWDQLPCSRPLKILDFGSGFGITANHLAARHHVVAVEPNRQMCEMRMRENAYVQYEGSLEAIAQAPEESFDLVLCHNVLEYVEDKDAYVASLTGRLKPGGILSLVKHNHAGRVMQKIVFENDLEAASQLMDGEPAYAQFFGEVGYYGAPDIERWINAYGYRQLEHYGIRAFYALNPDNAIRYADHWMDSMFALERKASRIEAYRSIAFFHHLLLEKT